MEVKQGYKQTEVGVIPLTWDVVSFDEIANKHKKWSITGGPFGSNLKVSDYTADGIQIIQLQNIGDGVFHDESQIFTSKEKADELISCNIYAGEIILSKMGDPVARACFIPCKAERYVMASDGIRLLVDEAKFSKKFIHDYINSSYFRKRAFEISTGTTRQRIGLPELKTLLVICPPLPEQTAIANALTDMDSLISQTEKLIEKKKAIKQGAMQELLKPKAGWVTKKLGDLVSVIKSGGTPLTSIKEYYNGEIPFLSISDMTSQGKYLSTTSSKISQNGLDNSSSWLVQNGSLIYSMYASVGFVSLNKIDIAISQAVLGMKFKDFMNLNFMYYTLLSMQKSVLKFVGEGTQKNLNAASVKKFDIKYPSTFEQESIADILSNMDSDIDLQIKKLKKLKQQKQGMMQALLTGKIRLVS